MIDYLLTFPDAAAAYAAFPPPSGEEGVTPPAWTDAEGRAVMPVQVYRVVDPGDDENPPTHENAAGFWLAIATNFADETVWDLPNAMHETDRKAAGRGDDPILRTRFSPEQLALGWQVTPVWAGSDYGF